MKRFNKAKPSAKSRLRGNLRTKNAKASTRNVGALSKRPQRKLAALTKELAECKKMLRRHHEALRSTLTDLHEQRTMLKNVLVAINEIFPPTEKSGALRSRLSEMGLYGPHPIESGKAYRSPG